ncbi:MAG: DNA polymerase III subunit alpha [Thermodesulfobacteriota bacterium]|nr:DNA polymerase III subunit alpha [Thermodesulfobacteriota bacterium]
MIPLTVRSYYSLMWGVCSPEKICAVAKQRGYNRLALTDTDNLYGLWRFLKACRHKKITPIVGSELTDRASGRRAICLVENDEGYRNLCRLITRRRSDKTFDLKSAVPEHATGLVIITQAMDLLQDWHEAGVTVAAAIVCRPDESAFRLRRMAGYLNIPAAATPWSFFLDPDDAKIHRILRAIDLNTSLSKLTPEDTAPSGSWLAPVSEYAERFAVWPDVIRATESIAERLTFTGPSHGLVLPPWTDSQSKEDTERLLRDAAYKGAQRRYGDDLPEPVVERLEHELRIIGKMKFSTYFLVVRDIVSRSPRICGRGSGATSLVAFSLGITNVCPIKHNLYFERFLNPGRSDPPDIDIDFAWDERDEILHSVLRQYNGHAALVCNHVTFQPRMAIRETAKVFGLTAREISRVAKRLPWFWQTDHTDDDLLTQLKHLPKFRKLDLPQPWPQIMRIAQRIINIPRLISVHPGGVVITPDRLDDYVPVEPAPKGVPVIQWEKNGMEESGLVKIDLLGNRSLGVIRDTILNLQNNNIIIDEESWNPEDDTATQTSVAQGDTMGCFYIESPAMRLLQKKTKTGDFEHLVIHSSIIRPAANEFIREYIRRLHGGDWEPIHPLLADVLEETYGIMVYQEDVSKTAIALAGFSHADADGLRKIISKKDKTRMLSDYKERFSAGAQARGVSDEQIKAVWKMMMSFSGYSFCKPHSASYARVSFQAAYLKTHYPAEFMAAVISNQGGFYSTFAYVSEARRTGVKILPPDVNKSDIRWKGKANAMRVGLLSIRHVSADTRKRIVTKREAGPYHDIANFLERVRPDAREAHSLIHAGAFNSLHPDKKRTSLLWKLAACRQKSSSTESGPRDLFSRGIDIPEPSFPAEKGLDRLRHEFTALGFLCDRHPMALYADILKKSQIVKAGDLRRFTGRNVSIAGLLITGKVVHTKHGDPMEFLTFEDETGLVETTFFPETYRRYSTVLCRNRPLILHGKVEEDFGALTMTVRHVENL